MKITDYKSAELFFIAQITDLQAEVATLTAKIGALEGEIGAIMEILERFSNVINTLKKRIDELEAEK